MYATVCACVCVCMCVCQCVCVCVCASVYLCTAAVMPLSSLAANSSLSISCSRCFVYVCVVCDALCVCLKLVVFVSSKGWRARSDTDLHDVQAPMPGRVVHWRGRCTVEGIHAALVAGNHFIQPVQLCLLSFLLSFSPSCMYSFNDLIDILSFVLTLPFFTTSNIVSG